MSAPKADFPDLAIGDLFELQVDLRPEATALRFRDVAVCYGDLDRAANRVSWRLLRQGISPGAVVAVAMQRSPDFVAALLGILKIGAAYLPIDQRWPEARIRTTFETAAVRVVVTDGESGFALPGDAAQLATKNDGAGSDAPGTRPRLPVPASQAAYVNFTSGSSGAPKGVIVPHRGVVSLVFGQSFIPLSAATVTLQQSSPGFDVMAFELWAPLLHGGTCVLFDSTLPSISRLGEAIRRNDVNTMALTTALFNVIIDSAPDVLDPLVAATVGGEAQSLRHVRVAQKRFPHVALVNAYGPTEAAVITTAFPFADLAPGALTVPLGRAINHREVVILRPDRTPAAMGETGEICITGPGLALGYVGRPDLTAERFVMVPGLSGEARLIYRTGDLGRCDETGVLEFLGRNDQQIKLNGYRIELEEVERALLAHPGVLQAAAVPHGEGVTRALKAAVVAPNGIPADLRDALARTLPPYMIPASLRAVESLPLNTNGKIDRTALGMLFEEASESTGQPLATERDT